MTTKPHVGKNHGNHHARSGRDAIPHELKTGCMATLRSSQARAENQRVTTGSTSTCSPNPLQVTLTSVEESSLPLQRTSTITDVLRCHNIVILYGIIILCYNQITGRGIVHVKNNTDVVDSHAQFQMEGSSHHAHALLAHLSFTLAGYTLMRMGGFRGKLCSGIAGAAACNDVITLQTLSFGQLVTRDGFGLQCIHAGNQV